MPSNSCKVAVACGKKHFQPLVVHHIDYVSALHGRPVQIQCRSSGNRLAVLIKLSREQWAQQCEPLCFLFFSHELICRVANLRYALFPRKLARADRSYHARCRTGNARSARLRARLCMGLCLRKCCMAWAFAALGAWRCISRTA